MIVANVTPPPSSNLRELCAPCVKNHRSPLPPALSLCKIRPLPTRSESTLPQLLIPLQFKSFRRNAYKKPGEGPIAAPRKFVNSSLAPRRSCGPNARMFFAINRLLTTLCTPRGWASPIAADPCKPGRAAVRPSCAWALRFQIAPCPGQDLLASASSQTYASSGSPSNRR